MQDLIILGTGVHAAEMAEIVERLNAVRPTWNLLGHIAGKPDEAKGELNSNPILGTIEALADHPKASVVPDNEFPRGKLDDLPRERVVNLIDPSAAVSRSAEIGVGCVVYPSCFIGYRARLGDFVFMLSAAIVNHDDVIEDRVVFASGAKLAGVVHVEADAYLGQACTVRQCLRLGRKCLIGTGAVVVKDVEPNAVMIGNPARKLRTRK